MSQLSVIEKEIVPQLEPSKSVPKGAIKSCNYCGKVLTIKYMKTHLARVHMYGVEKRTFEDVQNLSSNETMNSLTPEDSKLLYPNLTALVDNDTDSSTCLSVSDAMNVNNVLSDSSVRILKTSDVNTAAISVSTNAQQPILSSNASILVPAKLQGKVPKVKTKNSQNDYLNNFGQRELFFCDFCSRKFPSIPLLKNHIKNYHNLDKIFESYNLEESTNNSDHSKEVNSFDDKLAFKEESLTSVKSMKTNTQNENIENHSSRSIIAHNQPTVRTPDQNLLVSMRNTSPKVTPVDSFSLVSRLNTISNNRGNSIKKQPHAECKLCLKLFCSTANVKRHMKTCHPNEEIQYDKVPLKKSHSPDSHVMCVKTFPSSATKESDVVSKQVHTDKQFIMHRNITTYESEFHNKSLCSDSKEELLAHISQVPSSSDLQNKSVPKNFMCNLCPKKYARKHTLTRHFKTTHPELLDINKSVNCQTLSIPDRSVDSSFSNLTYGESGLQFDTSSQGNDSKSCLDKKNEITYESFYMSQNYNQNFMKENIEEKSTSDDFGTLLKESMSLSENLDKTEILYPNLQSKNENVFNFNTELGNQPVTSNLNQFKLQASDTKIETFNSYSESVCQSVVSDFLSIGSQNDIIGAVDTQKNQINNFINKYEQSEDSSPVSINSSSTLPNKNLTIDSRNICFKDINAANEENFIEQKQTFFGNKTPLLNVVNEHIDENLQFGNVFSHSINANFLQKSIDKVPTNFPLEILEKVEACINIVDNLENCKQDVPNYVSLDKSNPSENNETVHIAFNKENSTSSGGDFAIKSGSLEVNLENANEIENSSAKNSCELFFKSDDKISKNISDCVGEKPNTLLNNINEAPASQNTFNRVILPTLSFEKDDASNVDKHNFSSKTEIFNYSKNNCDSKFLDKDHNIAQTSHPCRKCQEKFSSMELLKKHLKMFHKIPLLDEQSYSQDNNSLIENTEQLSPPNLSLDANHDHDLDSKPTNFKSECITVEIASSCDTSNIVENNVIENCKKEEKILKNIQHDKEKEKTITSEEGPQLKEFKKDNEMALNEDILNLNIAKNVSVPKCVIRIFKDKTRSDFYKVDTSEGLNKKKRPVKLKCKPRVAVSCKIKKAKVASLKNNTPTFQNELGNYQFTKDELPYLTRSKERDLSPEIEVIKVVKNKVFMPRFSLQSKCFVRNKLNMKNEVKIKSSVYEKKSKPTSKLRNVVKRNSNDVKPISPETTFFKNDFSQFFLNHKQPFVKLIRLEIGETETPVVNTSKERLTDENYQISSKIFDENALSKKMPIVKLEKIDDVAHFCCNQVINPICLGIINANENSKKNISVYEKQNTSDTLEVGENNSSNGKESQNVQTETFNKIKLLKECRIVLDKL